MRADGQTDSQIAILRSRAEGRVRNLRVWHPSLFLITEYAISSESVYMHYNVHGVPIKTSTSYFLKNSVKNLAIWMIFSTQNSEEISRK